MSIKGTVLEIQRMSTEDGPGIRTTVFLKGCPLSCRWCHNPESIDPKPEVRIIPGRCIGCRTCQDICKSSAIQFTSTSTSIDVSKCQRCGSCVEACPAAAAETLGKNWDVVSLLEDLLKDKAFFGKDGGGVTISGGEALTQKSFTFELLKALKENGIHCAVDTCGFVSAGSLLEIAPLTDLFLYDLKEADSKKHLDWTGQSNSLIFSNLRLLLKEIVTKGLKTKVWIRTPLIPGLTATNENLKKLASLINGFSDEEIGVIERWDLCAFNNLCQNKYTLRNETWSLAGTKLVTKSEMADFVNVLKQELSGRQMTINGTGMLAAAREN